MKFGAQTYAWQMSYEKYCGSIPHILDVCKNAGFAGLEIETSMLGEFRNHPDALKAEFDKRDMTLVAIGVPIAWGISSKEEIYKMVQLSMDVAAPFDSVVMSFSIIPPEQELDRREEQQKFFLEFLNEIGEKAVKKGYVASFHTNSSLTSLFHSREDYRILKKFFEETGMGFSPDAGHIAHGGMDVVEIFEEFMPHIRHVHFKDMADDGTWTPMGEGSIPFGTLVRMLAEGKYSGWVVVEEESERAVYDPDQIMLQNGQWMKKIIL